MMISMKRSKNCLRNLKGFCKKGSIIDQLTLIVLPVFLLALVIVFGFAYIKTSDGLRDSTEQLSGTPQYDVMNESLSETVEKNADRYPPFWDFIFVAFIFIVWILIFISAFILGNNPIFLIAYGILSFVSIIVGIGIKIALVKMVTAEQFLWLMNQMPMTVWLANSYIYVSLAFIISIGIALYMKRQ